jgi:hypothetical protein
MINEHSHTNNLGSRITGFQDRDTYLKHRIQVSQLEEACWGNFLLVNQGICVDHKILVAILHFMAFKDQVPNGSYPV